MTLPNVDREALGKLRREMQAARGIAKRARESAMLLRNKANEAEQRADRLKWRIIELGGTVRS